MTLYKMPGFEISLDYCGPVVRSNEKQCLLTKETHAVVNFISMGEA